MKINRSMGFQFRAWFGPVPAKQTGLFTIRDNGRNVDPSLHVRVQTAVFRSARSPNSQPERFSSAFFGMHMELITWRKERLLRCFARQLRPKNRRKKAAHGEKKVLFHHDNAPAHTSMETMVKLDELRYELVDHPTYSPDLAPSDYYLFWNLKTILQGKTFSSNAQVILCRA